MGGGGCRALMGEFSGAHVGEFCTAPMGAQWSDYGKFNGSPMWQCRGAPVGEFSGACMGEFSGTPMESFVADESVGRPPVRMRRLTSGASEWHWQ